MMRQILLLGCFVALASGKPSVVNEARSLENALYEFLEAKDAVDESLSNVIGTPCSDKLDDAQLDILIGIDITAEQDSLDQVRLQRGTCEKSRKTLSLPKVRRRVVNGYAISTEILLKNGTKLILVEPRGRLGETNLRGRLRTPFFTIKKDRHSVRPRCRGPVVLLKNF